MGQDTDLSEANESVEKAQFWQSFDSWLFDFIDGKVTKNDFSYRLNIRISLSPSFGRLAASSGWASSFFVGLSVSMKPLFQKLFIF
jgi:hypothetical protein